jgi:hypothetical protein
MIVILTFYQRNVCDERTACGWKYVMRKLYTQKHGTVRPVYEAKNNRIIGYTTRCSLQFTGSELLGTVSGHQNRTVSMYMLLYLGDSVTTHLKFPSEHTAFGVDTVGIGTFVGQFNPCLCCTFSLSTTA